MNKLEHPRDILIKSIIENAIPTLSNLLKRNGIETIHLEINDDFQNRNNCLLTNDGFILVNENEPHLHYQNLDDFNSNRNRKRYFPKDYFDLKKDLFTTYQLVMIADRIKNRMDEFLEVEAIAIKHSMFFKSINLDYNEKKLLLEIKRN
jgi:hypothetical protein